VRVVQRRMVARQRVALLRERRGGGVRRVALVRRAAELPPELHRLALDIPLAPPEPRELVHRAGAGGAGRQLAEQPDERVRVAARVVVADGEIAVDVAHPGVVVAEVGGERPRVDAALGGEPGEVVGLERGIPVRRHPAVAPREVVHVCRAPARHRLEHHPRLADDDVRVVDRELRGERGRAARAPGR